MNLRYGRTFLFSRKITRALARIKLGLQDCIYLGNLNAKRDWGMPGIMWKQNGFIWQQSEPRDLVIATGEQH